jgi:hypothetical protein
MLEVRVKQLEKQAREDFRYNESLLERLAPFLRKDVAEKEVAKKEVAEKEVTEKEWQGYFLLCHTTIFNNLYFKY